MSRAPVHCKRRTLILWAPLTGIGAAIYTNNLADRRAP